MSAQIHRQITVRRSRTASMDAERPRASYVRLATSLFLAIFVLLGLVVQSASATSGRQKIAAFGPDGTSQSQFARVEALAVDQANNHLYAVDGSSNKLYGFDVATPDAPAPLGGNFPLDLSVPPFQGVTANDRLAVDNTGLSTAGNLYYASTASGKIFGFDSSGNPLGGNFPISIPSPGAEFDALAVDPAGHLWVSDHKAKIIREYSSSGTLEGVPIDTSDVGEVYILAFDANGDLYLTAPNSANNQIHLDAYRYTAASGYTSHVKVKSGVVIGLDVDTTTHQFYLAYVNSGPFGATTPIDVYDAAGTLLYQFGANNEFGQYRSLAVDSGTDSVFAWDQGFFQEGNQGGIHRQIAVFGGYGPEPVFHFDTPSGVTGTQATLNGSINPEGGTLGECRFEYGLSTSYGKSTPCSGSIPADTTPHPVSASLSNLGPQSVYHYRIAVNRGPTTLRSGDATFSTLETFVTKPASAIGDTSATLNGSVNLEGTTLSECKFEYGATTLYGASKPCVPAAGSIPADFADHSVSAALSGLMPQGTYHFRLRVANANGTFAGKDETFTALGPPLVTEEEAAPVGGTSATLLGEVNPGGQATGYHFEWGTDSSYGHRVPAEGELPAGSSGSGVAVETELSGLTGGTTYHFRVVASNGSGTTEGPDQIFSTFRPNASCPNAAIRAAQVSSAFPEGTVDLPDCMALEKVTPQKKYNQRSAGPQFSPSGDRVQFSGEGALVGTPSLNFVSNYYMSTRGPSGWTPQYIMPPAKYSAGFVDGGRPCGYSADFSHWTTWFSTDLQSELGITTPFQGTLGGDFTPIGPSVKPLSGGIGGNGGTIGAIKQGVCEGSSADATRLFFSIFDAAYLPGDPRIVTSGDSMPDQGNVYEAYLDDEGTPSLRLLQRDRDGNVVGGRCGARIGGGSGNYVRYRGSVSADASRVYFTARPSQPEGVPCDATVNKSRIMEWQETPTGPTIAPLFGSECTRVSPPCSSMDGDDEYLGASQEGTKVYFSTTRQLANSDLDTSRDLYLYDASRPAGERLTEVSAGDSSDPTPGEDGGFLGLSDFSGDGSRAYLVAEGVMTTALNRAGQQAVLGKPNLYLYERDAAHPAGTFSFIATLSTGDASTWGGPPGAQNEAKAVPRLGSNVEDFSVGGNGHILVFATRAALATDDQDGGERDIYRYDSLTGLLQQVSRADAGGDGNGASPVALISGEETPGAQGISFNRGVSENSRTIVFASDQRLDPNDSDGHSNTYIWRDGTVTAIPTTTDGGSVSMSGKEVGVSSKAKLLPEDGDATTDGYVLRIEGGFPIINPPPPCGGEACQGTPTARPGDQGAASAGATPGNVTVKPPPKPCRKGTARRHGRCVKPRPSRKHRKHAKRAGHKQGGQK